MLPGVRCALGLGCLGVGVCLFAPALGDAPLALRALWGVPPVGAGGGSLRSDLGPDCSGDLRTDRPPRAGLPLAQRGAVRGETCEPIVLGLRARARALVIPGERLRERRPEPGTLGLRGGGILNSWY